MRTRGAERTVGIMRGAIVLWVVGMCVLGCSRGDVSRPAVRTEPSVVQAPSALEAGASEAGPAPAASGGPVFCRVASAPETIEDGEGKAASMGTTRLENVRVLADGDALVVTWERQSDFQIGDAWRAPVFAMRKGRGPFVVRQLPVSAHACATNGYAGVASTDAPLVAWGVADDMGFQLWKAPPAVTEVAGFHEVKTPPTSRRATPRQSLRGFVASRTVALATTADLSCDDGCSCLVSATNGLWTFDLADRRPPARLVSSPPSGRAPEVPALAMGAERGVAAWRVEGELYLAWLDGSGKPLGAPLRVDVGDVGAPALAIAGSRVVVVWARHDAAEAPYRLRWMLVEHGASALPPPETLVTAGSALAPAVLTDGKDAVFAWMEGDGGARGVVLAARVVLAHRSAAPRTVVVSSSDERNARDPELSGTVDAPVVAYSTFSSLRPGGVARVARLACGDGPP
jgi:hypothetical protein